MGRKTSDEMLAKIVDVYRETLSAPAVVRATGVSQQVIYRTLKEAGIEVSRAAKATRQRRSSDEVEQEIMRRYAAGELSSALAKAFGYSMAGIRKVVRRQGGAVGPRGNRFRDFTPDEIAAMAARWESGESQTVIARAFNSSQITVSRVLRANGYSVGPRRPSGENHGSWKGGRTQNGQGYWAVMVPNDHPYASMKNREGYIPEHRLAMAQVLDRPLLDHETVHHIDGDKSNNDPSNLQLRQGKHGKGVVMQCADCGSHNIVGAPLAALTLD